MTIIHYKNNLGLWEFKILNEASHIVSVSKPPGFSTMKQMIDAAAKELI